MPRRPLVLFVAMMALGCGSGPPKTASVAVTIHPLRLIAQAVAGPEIQVVGLLPTGVSPHAYEPVPSAARAANSAALVLAAHPDVDGWVARLSEGPPWWLEPDPRAQDPHAWLDPAAVKAALPRLVEVLCGAFADSCDGFRSRSASFAAELNQLIEESRQSLEGRELVTTAPFLSGFASTAGASIVAVVAPVEGVDPTPGDITRAISAARSAGSVVGQSVIVERAGQLVAEASGVPLYLVDPIGTPESTPDYPTLIRNLIAGIGP